MSILRMMNKNLGFCLLCLFLLFSCSSFALTDFRWNDAPTGYKSVAKSGFSIEAPQEFTSCEWDNRDGWDNCVVVVKITNKFGTVLNPTASTYNWLFNNLTWDDSKSIRNVAFSFTKTNPLVNKTIVAIDADGNKTTTIETWLDLTGSWASLSAQGSFSLNSALWARMDFERKGHAERHFDYSFLDPNVSACGSLSVGNSTYVLTQNISTTATCISVTNNSIILDGMGYWITGSYASAQVGVSATNRLNFTLKNVTIAKFANGVSWSYTNNSVIANVSIRNINSTGTTNGIYLFWSHNNSLSNIWIENVSGASGAYGLYFYQTRNNTASFIDIINVSRGTNSNYYGFQDTTAAQFNILKNSRVTKSYNGIREIGQNETFTNNTVTLCYNGLSLYAANLTFTGNNLSQNYYNLQSFSFFSPFKSSSISNNWLNEKKLYYNESLWNYEFNPTTASDFGGLICPYCSNVTVNNFTLQTNANPLVYFYYSNNSLVSNLVTSGNGGIILGSTNTTTIANVSMSNYTCSVGVQNIGYWNSILNSNFTSLGVPSTTTFAIYFSPQSGYGTINNVNISGNTNGMEIYSSHNQLSNANITLNGTSSPSGITTSFVHVTTINNTFTNFSILAYCDSCNGVNYVMDVTHNSVYSHFNITTYGLYAYGFYNDGSENVTLDDINITNYGDNSVSIYLGGSNVSMNNMNITNYGAASFGIQPFDLSSISNSTITTTGISSADMVFVNWGYPTETQRINVTDTQLKGSNWQVYFQDWGQTTPSSLTFLNVSYDPTAIFFESTDPAVENNITIQWYARVNVTSSPLFNPLVATVNVSDVFGNLAYYGDTSTSGLTPWVVITESIRNRTGIIKAFNNHTVSANKTNYLTNSTSRNITTADQTISLTLDILSCPVCQCPNQPQTPFIKLSDKEAPASNQNSFFLTIGLIISAGCLELYLIGRRKKGKLGFDQI